MLALAYKQLPAEMTPSELRHLPRDHAESELQFAGTCMFFRFWHRRSGCRSPLGLYPLPCGQAWGVGTLSGP